MAEKLGHSFEQKINQNNPNLHADALENRLPKVATLDFSSERKAMSTVVSKPDGSNMVLLKGAPERVLDKCDGYLANKGQSKSFHTSNAKADILKEIQDQARKGLRCIAIAVAEDGGNMKHLNKDNLSQELADMT